MKKFYVFMIALILVLGACSSSSAGNDNNDSNNNTNTQTEENANAQNNGQEAQNDEAQSEENSDNESNDDANDEEDSDKVSDVSPAYEVSQETWQIKPLTDDVNENVLLLTIDDAPDEHALEMAQTLKDLDAGAIFFVNGHFLETDEEKEILKKIYDMGFLIGNHTYSHAYLPDLSPEDQREEIIEVSDMVEDVIGERPDFFRAPNGANTDTSAEVAEDEDMTVMNWSYGYDFKEDYMSKEAITDIMLNTELLQSGANLLMHDREWTNAALEDIVTGLRDKDYEMVDPHLIQTKEDK